MNRDREEKLATPIAEYRRGPNGKGLTPMRRTGSLRVPKHHWCWKREVRDGVNGWYSTCGGMFGKACPRKLVGCGEPEGWHATEYGARRAHQAHLRTVGDDDNPGVPNTDPDSETGVSDTATRIMRRLVSLSEL
jgi:hypothetical protein